MATIRVSPLHTVLDEDGPARVSRLMEHLSTEAGVDAAWVDDGQETLAQPWDPMVLHAVRSLAAHMEYPPSFLGIKRAYKLGKDPRASASLQRIFDGDQTAFPHLMRHSDNKGLWVPAALPAPVAANEQQWWMVGSVPGVLEELGRLESRVDEGGPRLRQAFESLKAIFETARRAGLPVIID